MNKLIKTGQVFFAIMLMGLGIQQFITPVFRPVILPEWPSWIPGMTAWVYLSGLALVLAGIAIILEWKAKKISFYTGIVLLLVVLLFHLPYRLRHNPEILGAWTNAFKLLAISGSAFIVAGSFKSNDNGSRLNSMVKKLIPVGQAFFSIMLIVFGIDHFLYIDFVKTLVPSWIPGPVFWSYFGAVALIGAGAAILLRIQVRTVALLLGIMLFLWLVILHIPRAITYPYHDDAGNELTSVFQCLGFSGIAFIIAGISGFRARI